MPFAHSSSFVCVNKVLDYGSIDVGHFVPSTLESLCKEPESLARLSRLKFISGGGGMRTASSEIQKRYPLMKLS
jgi:hypothetical protein